MFEDDPARVALARLIAERREDYAALSRLLGRNAAYVQQYIKRGTPRRLAETDRHTLAGYFGVDEALLGAPDRMSSEAAPPPLVQIPRYDVGVAAGAGAFGDDQLAHPQFGFDAAWLRALCRGRGADLSMVRVQGDSMAPTLADGDDILVDASEGADRLRDGIYVLRRDDTLVVKRVAVHPGSKRVTVSSDNPAYPAWPDCRPATLGVIGRVVWAGRKVS